MSDFETQLDKRRAYYEYRPGAGDWFYHEPPTLDPTLHRELTRIDRSYRFLWAGVALVRDRHEDPHPAIRGDKAATKVVDGRLSPRYFFGRHKYPKCLKYKDKKNRVVRVARADQVPQGRLTWWDYSHIEFGQLRWILERFLTTEQLIAAGIYLPSDPLLPAGGDYIHRLTIETPEHGYWEPTREYIQCVIQNKWEEENESANDLLMRDREADEKAEQTLEAEKEERETAEVTDHIEKLLSQPQNTKYLLPIERF